MTEIGYRNIIDRVLNRSINLPDNLTLPELRAYIDGYSTCQNDIIAIIQELMEGQLDK